MPWPRGIRFQLLTEILEAHAQVSRVAESIGPPDVLDELIRGHDRTGMSREAFEYPILERREMNFSRGGLSSTPRQIDFDLTELEQRQLLYTIKQLVDTAEGDRRISAMHGTLAAQELLSPATLANVAGHIAMLGGQ